jgi:sodium/hydrogen antiporter
MGDTLTLVAILFATILVYNLVAKKISDSILTAPMIFLVVGLVVSPLVLGAIDFESNRELILIYAELALSVALFTDAASIDTRKARKNPLPVRLLFIGLPLTIGLGTILALMAFAGITLGEAGLIGSILAPTDAALGQAILHNKHVPENIRNGMDVESGLNDGGSIPFFALFLTLAQVEAGELSISGWVIFSLQQIGLGIFLGVIVGFIGAYLINRSIGKGWIKPNRRPIAFIALAILAFLIADLLGGSGFIAAYIAGLTVAAFRHYITEELVEYAEVEGEALSLGVFFILGLMFITVFPYITWLVIVYAILSLTLVRMGPVWISLVRTKLKSKDKVFIGWFGPRGLASIVLVIIALGETGNIAGLGTVVAVCVLTVVMSIFAHGITAAPLAKLFYPSGGDDAENT